MTGDLFAGLDAAAVDRVAEAIGTRMAGASALSSMLLVRDGNVETAEFAAGLAKAHLLGAASALLAAQSQGVLALRSDAAIARDAARVVVDALAVMRRAG